MNEPNPHDVVLGNQEKEEQYSLRDDIELVLRQLEQQDGIIQERVEQTRATHGERRINLKATHEQKIIKLLMEKGSRQMLLPLLGQLEETNQQRIEYYHSLHSENQYLREENRALIGQLSAIAYILNHEEEFKGELPTKERILRILKGITEFSNMFDSLVKVFSIVEFALTYLHGQNKKPPIRIIREMNSLVEEIKSKRGYSRFFDVFDTMRDD